MLPFFAGRFHAFEVAHDLDKNYSGRGVRQFKTTLLQRLEQDEEITIWKGKRRVTWVNLNVLLQVQRHHHQAQWRL